jgi:hypothetical protein
MIICYLVTFSILKQRPFQNRLMKLTNLIMHGLFTDFTIIICYLVIFFNSKTTPFLNRLMKLTNLGLQLYTSAKFSLSSGEIFIAIFIVIFILLS